MTMDTARHWNKETLQWESRGSSLDEVAKEWMTSRDIIAGFLRELQPDKDALTHLNNAADLIVRLASHEPPIIVGFDGPDPDAHADLLAACVAVYGQLNYLRGLWGDEGITRRLCDQIEAAIAKAKGV